MKSTLIVGVPSDTNGFHRTSGVSVRKTLRKLSSSGQRGSKVVPMESIGTIGHKWIPSDTNGFHRTSGVSVRKTLRKLSSSVQRGSKVVPMESIGTIGHKWIPSDKWSFCS